MMMNISIILPTINEADNLKLLIPEIIKNLETVMVFVQIVETS